jgi:hypothetical protein
LGFAHMPWFKPLCSSCNSAKGNRLTYSDVQALIAKEAEGVTVASFQIKALWDASKNGIDSDESALKLSKLLRINQHYYLFLLKELYDLGQPEFLLTLLKPELAAEKIEFVGLDPANYSFKEIKRTSKADTYAKSKAARMVRIAFDSLDDYASKEKRNIHSIPAELEESLRKDVVTNLKSEAGAEQIQDRKMSKALLTALRADLGPEERAALAEAALSSYCPAASFENTTRSLRAYVDGIGKFLAAD